MADKIIAPIALALFLTFVAFLAVYVNRPALWVVIVVVCVFAVIDFWITLRKPNNGNSHKHS